MHSMCIKIQKILAAYFQTGNTHTIIKYVTNKIEYILSNFQVI